MKVKPISPKSIKAIPIDDRVIEVFNRLITQKWDGKESVITITEATIAVRMALGLETGESLPKGIMDVEQIYRDEGWKVDYDGPAYCETYEGYYTFSK